MSSRRLAMAMAVSLSAALACAGNDGDESEQSGLPSLPDQGPASMFEGVQGYERSAGMPIGQGATGNAEDQPDEPMLGQGGAASTPSEDPDDIEIPMFETPTGAPPPCSGCVELNVDVSDINQRDTFAFSAGGVNVTRVVWNLVIPFNSDQLFVQPFVDSAYGTYTQLHANTFATDTPVQLVHQYSGLANNVGLALGSSGAWTGNMTMSVFVDSVTLEGAEATASRSFDADAQGLTTRSANYNPQVVFHP
jgi:hypothetical protein